MEHAAQPVQLPPEPDDFPPQGPEPLALAPRMFTDDPVLEPREFVGDLLEMILERVGNARHDGFEQRHRLFDPGASAGDALARRLDRLERPLARADDETFGEGETQGAELAPDTVLEQREIRHHAPDVIVVGVHLHAGALAHQHVADRIRQQVLPGDPAARVGMVDVEMQPDEARMLEVQI